MATTTTTGLPYMAPGQQVAQPVPAPTPTPTIAEPKPTSPVPAMNPDASQQQTATASMVTSKGISPESAFSTPEAYQKYLKNASGYGSNYVNDTADNEGTWVNKQDPNASQASAQTPAPAPAQSGTAAPTPSQNGTLPPPLPDSAASDGSLMKDDGTKLLESSTDEYLKGLDPLEKEVQQWKAEDLQSVQAEYDAKKGVYDEAKKKLEEINQKQQEVIQSGATAQKAEIEAAYKAAKANVDLQKAETDKAYKEMVAAQQLANKRAEIKKETAMGILGGSFTTAGVADIESVIMEGEFKVISIQQDADLKQQGFTNQLNALVDDYKVSNMKVEQWKAEAINSAYTDLQNKLMDIMNSEADSEAQKQQQIRGVNQMYNEKISSIHADALQVKYNLAQTIVQRSDQLKSQAAEAKDKAAAMQKLNLQEENQTRDDARTALQNLISTLPAETFQNLNAQQKAQIQELEQKAGYPVGLTEQGIKTFKEESADQKELYQNANLDLKQKMLDLKKEMGDKVQFMTDENGNVTAVTFDPATNQFSTKPLGQMGKASAQYGFMTDSEGNIIPTNKYNGGVGSDAFSGNGGYSGGSGISQGPVNKPTSSGTTKNFTSTAVAGSEISPEKFAQVFKVGTKQGWCGDFASRISTASKVGNTWAEKKSHITHYDNPQPGDKIVLPWGVNDKGEGYGHVMVVLDSDKGPPATVNVVQSNADGRQNKNSNNLGIVTQATYNIDEWNKKYGEGEWGFVKGELKPNIQKQLSGPQQSSDSSAPQSRMMSKMSSGSDSGAFKAGATKGLASSMQGLFGNLKSTAKPLTYDDAYNKAQQLYGKTAVPKAKIQWMKKNINNGNVAAVQEWLNSLQSTKKGSSGSKYKIDLSGF